MDKEKSLGKDVRGMTLFVDDIKKHAGTKCSTHGSLLISV